MTISTPPEQVSGFRPLLARVAVDRVGGTSIPGDYCPIRHVWLADGRALIESSSSIAELVTKTNKDLERDDQSFLLELQTKTKAELERDDQGQQFNGYGL